MHKIIKYEEKTMKSEKKISQIKKFAKGKVAEFIAVAGVEVLDQLELASFTIHLNNYSYENQGSNLISFKFKNCFLSFDHAPCI